MSGPSPLPLKAIVKSVTSGDSLVLRARGNPIPGQTPQERVLHLAYLQAPRKEEVYAVQSRDTLRALVVGREISFQILYSAAGLEFGNVVLSKPDGSNIDVGLTLLQQGAAKVRESRNTTTTTTEGSENAAEQARKVQLGEAEQQAKSEGLGLWAEDVQKIDVRYSMPDDPDAFMDQFGKGKKVDACIESVNNGTTVKARIQVAPDTYQVVTVAMAGCRAPRATYNNSFSSESNQPSSQDSGEPFGDEARLFTETRLLQRNVQVQLIALPPTPISSTASAPSFFIGHIIHPAGNIAQLLVASGLARCVDQHAAYLGAGGMSAFRNAEKQAKEKRLAIWSSLPPPSAAPINPTKANGGSSNGATADASSGLEKQFEGLVSRIWNAESLSVRMGKHGDGKEVKLFLSSIRQPRATDTKLAGLRAEAAEFLRKRAIGKHVNVIIDYHQPKSDNFEAKEMATVKLVNNSSNLAETLVERGYVTVIRHRQGDEDKSSEIDKLMEVEAKAIADKKGLHSGKEFPLPRIGDASESATKANSFLPSLKRGGKFPVVVDYVASGSRFKLLLPKQDVKITLVLGGIRAPRTARNAGEKSEPYGPEALDFVAKKCLQRDGEAEVTNTDKSGGFIGSLFINKENIAALLAREGLARVDDYNTTDELRQAEAAAKREKKNMWKEYEDEAEQEAIQNAAAAAQNPQARKEYVDVIISDIRSEPTFSFAVQILQTGGKLPELEKLMSDFATFHRTAQPAPITTPRSGDLVAARFSADNQWYRAKVRKANPAKKQAEVLFYDYGNSETLSFDQLRPLDARFKSLPPQAKEASLSFVQLLGNDTEYGQDAVHLFRDLCEGRPLVANIDKRDSNSVSLTLYDPDIRQSQTATSSINAEMVRNGLARVDKKSPLRSAYPQMIKALQEAMDEAKKARAGAFELGDFFDDD